jgi:hypothetical protein
MHYMDAAGELRDEYDRRKKAGKPVRAGWRDAIRHLESVSTSAPEPAGAPEWPRYDALLP